MNRMVDSVFEPLSRIATQPIRIPGQGFQPSVDVIEEDEDVRIEVEVPGMSPDELSVTLGSDSVVVRGEKKLEETEAKGLHRRERAYGPFRRVIHLPADSRQGQGRGDLQERVLTIVLPKSHEAAKKVEIKAARASLHHAHSGPREAAAHRCCRGGSRRQVPRRALPPPPSAPYGCGRAPAPPVEGRRSPRPEQPRGDTRPTPSANPRKTRTYLRQARQALKPAPGFRRRGAFGRACPSFKAT